MAKLGAGVIGLGMGAGHISAYENNPNVEVKAVCDTRLELAKQVARDHHIDLATADYRELVGREDIDIISVATPDHLHREHTVAALEAGKHVLCEKPMALTLEDCEAMIEAANANHRQLMVGQVCRFAPGFRLAKKLVERGEIGELFFVESEYAHNYEKIPGVGGWRADPKIKREPVIGGGCHAVDLLRWIAGECLEVSAYSNHKGLSRWPVDDCTIAAMKFENNVIGKVFVSIGCHRPYTMRSVFYGTKGTIICDNTTPSVKLYTVDIAEATDFITIPVSIASHDVSAEVEELVDALLSDKPVETDGFEGAKTIATCLAIVESARLGGKPVKVKRVGE